LVLKEPAAPDAPRGTCRWCGEQLTGERSAARNYCYLEREGRDCRGESNNSWCWTGRELIQRRGDPVCVDCGSDDPHWEADHDVPLEDGGVHEPGNLVRRCVPCHRRKTGAENRERARRRRRANALTLAPRRTTA
jgi:5-methylcytosine-specific restriction endonuclease McrA